MAPSSTIYKVELQVTDMDRHYYASHALTLAQHPSETALDGAADRVRVVRR